VGWWYLYGVDTPSILHGVLVGIIHPFAPTKCCGLSSLPNFSEDSISIAGKMIITLLITLLKGSMFSQQPAQ
jgi:hypothetical protein